MPNGPWVMLAGYVLFGLVPGLLKLGLSDGMDPSLAVLLRFAIAIALLGASYGVAKAFKNKNPELQLRAVDRQGLLLRGVFGGLAVATYFWAVQLCGVGLGTLLNYTHSIWSNVFAVLLGRQKPRLWFWPLLGLAGLGVYLVLDPQGGHISGAGLSIGLISGMAGGAAVLTIKTLRRTDNAISINMALAIGGIAVSIPLLFIQVAQSKQISPNISTSWLFVSVSGVFSLLGQILFTHGFKNTSVSFASIMSLITPIIATFTGYLFLNEVLTPHFLLGSSLILFSCAFIGWQETVEA